MSFAVSLALLIGVLVLVPIVAHLLRRGRAKEVPFPPTRFIPAREHVANQRSRFDDRLLLAVRAGIITVLALIGAAPLLRCDRATMTRRDGASIAAVIVLDDSASMRNRLASGEGRFDRAKRAANELISQMHSGDSLGLVLAGKPARVLLLPTTNPRILEQQLEGVAESDRSTDLVAAIALAESALDRQPHVDKRVVVLSDLAGALPKLSGRVSRLLPELAEPPKNCGVVSAFRNRGQIAVDVACSAEHPNVDRKLQLVRGAQTDVVLAEKLVTLHPGRDTFSLDNVGSREEAQVRLLGTDSNVHDDTAPVIDGSAGPTVATYSDPVAGRGTTGGPPLIEQALRALHPDLAIRPLATVPEDERELAGAGLLLLDDPPLLSAESRSVITAFAERGGAAVALFGPSAGAAQLGSLLLPFIERRATWEDTAPAGLEPASLATLGAAAESLREVAAKGRLVFDESHDPRVIVRGRWSDQRAFWIERPVGRGLVVALGLPASIGRSDLALRTGFMAWLEQMLGTSERLGVARITTVGRPWRFPNQIPVAAEGPSGPLALASQAAAGQTELELVPSEVGRYRLRFGTASEERFALLPVEELLEPSHPWPVTATAQTDKAAGRLDLSRSLVLALLPFLALELAMRSAFLRDLLRRAWRRAQTNAWTRKWFARARPAR